MQHNFHLLRILQQHLAHRCCASLRCDTHQLCGSSSSSIVLIQASPDKGQQCDRITSLVCHVYLCIRISVFAFLYLYGTLVKGHPCAHITSLVRPLSSHLAPRCCCGTSYAAAHQAKQTNKVSLPRNRSLESRCPNKYSGSRQSCPWYRTLIICVAEINLKS